MALDFMEAYEALAKETEIATKAKSAVDSIMALPAADRRAAMWCNAFGIGGVGLAVAQAYDTIHGGGVTAELVMGLVGVDPNGLVGSQMAMVQKLIADIKD